MSVLREYLSHTLEQGENIFNNVFDSYTHIIDKENAATAISNSTHSVDHTSFVSTSSSSSIHSPFAYDLGNSSGVRGFSHRPHKPHHTSFRKCSDGRVCASLIGFYVNPSRKKENMLTGEELYRQKKSVESFHGPNHSKWLAEKVWTPMSDDPRDIHSENGWTLVGLDGDQDLVPGAPFDHIPIYEWGCPATGFRHKLSKVCDATFRPDAELETLFDKGAGDSDQCAACRTYVYHDVDEKLCAEPQTSSNQVSAPPCKCVDPSGKSLPTDKITVILRSSLKDQETGRKELIEQKVPAYLVSSDRGVGEIAMGRPQQDIVVPHTFVTSWMNGKSVTATEVPEASLLKRLAERPHGHEYMRQQKAVASNANTVVNKQSRFRRSGTHPLHTSTYDITHDNARSLSEDPRFTRGYHDNISPDAASHVSSKRPLMTSLVSHVSSNSPRRTSFARDDVFEWGSLEKDELTSPFDIDDNGWTDNKSRTFKVQPRNTPMVENQYILQRRRFLEAPERMGDMFFQQVLKLQSCKAEKARRGNAPDFICEEPQRRNEAAQDKRYREFLAPGGGNRRAEKRRSE